MQTKHENYQGVNMSTDLIRTFALLAVLLFVSISSSAQSPGVVFSGSFVKKEKSTTGTFEIVREGGQLALVLSDGFKTKGAPDLQIYFSELDVELVDSERALERDAFKVADLSSRKGSQHYDLPADLDLSRFKSVLIHCLKYNLLFGAASLDSSGN